MQWPGVEHLVTHSSSKEQYVIEIAKILQSLYGDKLVRPVAAVYAGVPPDEIAEGVGDKEVHIDGLIVMVRIDSSF